ncbi:MAG: ATP-binding protein [Anaerolineales bacterium]|jgi:signal transduction histidine kinase|nr:ATP-binding protein [Anaerolineales bacterium]
MKHSDHPINLFGAKARERRFNRPPPHWWPDDESWPPVSPLWRKNRPKLFPRLAIGALLTLVIVTVTCSGSVYILTRLSGGIDLHKPGALPVFLGMGILIAFATFHIGRTIRRVISPIDDLLEASYSVAEGDYSVKVPERGAPEMYALVSSFNAMVRQLESQANQRNELMADLTHELRTPITVVQGNIEGMIDGVYERDDAHLKALLEETKQLSNLIEDLRTLGLAESGALQLHREATDLTLLTSETLAAYRPQIEAAGTSLELIAAEGIPLINVDPLRFREVLTNLIANALRYTPSGETIKVQIEKEGADQIRIIVLDTGSGIDVHDLPYIFERFYKSADSAGSGLGLAIAKKLVEAHGGEISAESAPDRGTQITILLPI